MKKYLIVLLILHFSIPIFGQNTSISKNNFKKEIEQIKDSLPVGWTVKYDLTVENEIIIHSMEFELCPNMTSNDPPNLKGKCEISILILPWISSDSVQIIRKRNIKLKRKLTTQSSKDNLRNWYVENENLLKLLDEEPTNYDNNYSYRIKCNKLPKNNIDLNKYFQIMMLLNRKYTKYQDYILLNFEDKVKMAQLIIEIQPTKYNIKNILLEGFVLDSINTTGYFISYSDNIQLIAYLYKDTERIVAVGFYENNDNEKEIYYYVANEMKYLFSASQRMCDYFNNEKLSIHFCPNTNKGLMVYIQNFENL